MPTMPTTCFVDLTLNDDQQSNQDLQSNQVSYKKHESKATTKGYLLSKQGLAKSKTFEEKELEQPELKKESIPSRCQLHHSRDGGRRITNRRKLSSHHSAPLPLILQTRK